MALSNRSSLERRPSLPVEELGGAENPNHSPMTAFLIEAAEIEMRLRQHTQELIEPTIKKQVVLDRNFKELHAYTRSSRTDIDDLLSIKEASASTSNMIECFRVELAGWDKQRHEHEMKVSNRLSAQEVEINSLRQSLELLKGVDHTSVNRTLKTLGDMLNVYKDENTDLRRFCVERLDLNRDKIGKLRDEFETRTMAMENQMHRLQDMQTTTNTTITHINELVSTMDHRVNTSCEGVADLWRAKVSVACLEEQQQDLTEFMRHVNSVVSSLKQQFGSLTDDVKAHFETATHIVGRSTADQMDVMRTKYQEDLQRVDVLRNEIEEFVRSQQSGLEELSIELSSTKEISNVAISDLSNSIDKLRQRRERDQQNGQIEMGQLQRRIRELEAEITGGEIEGVGGDTTGTGPVSGTAATANAIEVAAPAAPVAAPAATCGAGTGGGPSHHHRQDALVTFVESAYMGLACELQDEKDRKAIGLYGLKVPEKFSETKGIGLPDISQKKGSTMSSPLSSPRRNRGGDKSRKTSAYPGDAGEGFIEPVMSIDSRCLSCSGSSATVLAGFKMACLQYQPGPVEYDGVCYTRTELVRKRMELLEQARAGLNQTRGQRPDHHSTAASAHAID